MILKIKYKILIQLIRLYRLQVILKYFHVIYKDNFVSASRCFLYWKDALDKPCCIWLNIQLQPVALTIWKFASVF